MSLWFFVKVLLSGAIIALASSLAGKRPVLAGFIIALPIMSMLSLLFSYVEFRDMEKANTFALSIITAIPLSLLFFLPFVLHKWWKLGFAATYVLGVGCVAIGYCLHAALTKKLF